MNEDALQTLSEAEVAYLLVNGWTLTGHDAWTSEEFRKTDIPQGHAVNCQKFWDNAQLSRKRTPSKKKKLVLVPNAPAATAWERLTDD